MSFEFFEPLLEPYFWQDHVVQVDDVRQKPRHLLCLWPFTPRIGRKICILARFVYAKFGSIRFTFVEMAPVNHKSGPMSNFVVYNCYAVSPTGSSERIRLCEV